jgi:hypothetical protein
VKISKKIEFSMKPGSIFACRFLSIDFSQKETLTNTKGAPLQKQCVPVGPTGGQPLTRVRNYELRK